MRARDRRYGKSSVKTRVGIATATLVGGAVAAAAALAANHGAAHRGHVGRRTPLAPATREPSSARP